MSRLIWTDHANARLRQRGVSKSMVEETVFHPHSSRPGKRPNSQELRRKFENRTLSVIAQKKQSGDWRILSTWLNPPLEGTSDWKEYRSYHKFRDEYEKAGFWGKFWVVLKRQLGF